MITVLNCYYLNVADSNVARFPCWGPEGCWQLTATAVSQLTATAVSQPRTHRSHPRARLSRPRARLSPRRVPGMRDEDDTGRGSIGGCQPPSPVPTDTPTPTPVPPTTSPSGTVSAGSTSIDVGESTTVTGTARNLGLGDDPSLQVTGAVSTSCPAKEETSVHRFDITLTLTVEGCSAGTGRVFLTLVNSGQTLDSVAITVSAVPTPAPAASATINAATTTLKVDQVVTVEVDFENITGDPMWLPTGAISTPGGCASRDPVAPQPFDISMTVSIQGCYAGSGTLTVSTTSGGALASETFTVNPAPTATDPPPAPSGFSITIQTGWGAQARWSYLNGAVEYRVEYRAVGDATWSAVTSKRDWLLVTNLTPGVTYQFRLSARGSGYTYTTAWGATTGIITATMTAPLRFDGDVNDLVLKVAKTESIVLPEATGGTSPYTYALTPALPSGLSFDDSTRTLSGAPTATQEAATYRYTVTESGNATWWEEFTITVEEPEVDLEAVQYNLFESQSAELTASSQSNVDTIYWLKWNGTGWTEFDTSTDNPATLTLDKDDFDDSLAGIRVRATFEDSTEEAYADTILLQWRPMTLEVDVSDLYPDANESVTLSVSGDIPSGATYQWQTRNGDGDAWTNVGTSASITDSDEETTKQYRVQISHSSATTAISHTVYVTWDVYDIYADLGGDLRDAVEGNNQWVSTQRALVRCMTQSRPSNRAPLSRAVAGSFAAIISNYSGEVRTRMEGTCRTQGNRMFAVHDTVHAVELKILRSTAIYDDLLDTPVDSWIATDLANAKKLRRDAKRAAKTSSSSDNTGLDCQSSDAVPTTVDAKLTILNCLTLDSSHSFWVKGKGTRDADTLREHDTSNTGKYRWLDTGGWDCDWSPDGPLTSCLKHDVAYGTLQAIVGTSDVDDLDTVWNPRNKALADERFRLDILEYGCQDETINFLADWIGWCDMSNEALARIYYGMVVKRNSKWPVTKSDLTEITRTASYVECPEPPVPMAQSVNPYRSSEGDFVIEFAHNGGCLNLAVSKVEYVTQWEYSFTKGSFESWQYALGLSHRYCELINGLLTCTFDIPENVRIKGTITMYAQPVESELLFPELKDRWRHYGGQRGSTGRVVLENVDLGF